MSKQQKNWLLFIPLLIVYVSGVLIDIMRVDAAQYSVMAMKMVDSGAYLKFYYHDQDYIDKPPFIFWVSALSFKLFGISNVAYKLPSVLFTLLGLFSTYRLAKIIYNERTAFYSTLVLASCQAWFLINHDIKTDTILAGATIFSIWQMVEFDRRKKLMHIVGAALGIAVAMLTKGPIGFMVPCLAIGTDFLLKRKWRSIFRVEWLFMLFVIFLCLLPMLYGLYQQFDLSDGRETYNGNIKSGIKFYFWTQSFGRITGESSWKNDTDPFYFAHTFLWAFLPWSVIFFIALGRRLKKLWRKRFKVKKWEEAITLGGTLLPAFVMSLSHYKLPQYIFVIFPLAAIITGQFLSLIVNSDRKTKLFNVLTLIQTIIISLLLTLIIFLCSFCFMLTNYGTLLVGFIGGLTVIYFIFYKGSRFQRLVIPSFVACVTVNFLLNTHVYPTLLTYQAGSMAGRIVNDHPIAYPIYTYGLFADSFEFYAQKNAVRLDTKDQQRLLQNKQPAWLFTDENGYKEIIASGIKFKQVKELKDYPVSKLKMKFLNPETRDGAVSIKYLLLL